MLWRNSYSKSEKKALAFATLFAVIFAAWFLRSYFSMFVIAGIFAYLFYPVYIWLTRRFGKGPSAALTICISFLSVLIPVIIVLVLTGVQVSNVADGLAPAFEDLDVTAIGERVLGSINSVLASLPFSVQPITEQMVIDGLRNIAVNVGSAIAGNITQTFTSFLNAFTSLIIYIFLLSSLLKHGSALLDMFRSINPLGKDLSNIYLSRIGAMVRGTLQGQFVIAAAQGLCGALAFAIVGYGNLFFVIFALFTLLSIIPLGAGIIAIPIGVIMMLFGNVWGGVFIILEHLLINTNIDNFLRPILVPKEARLDAALMLVSVFAGISLFGFLGIVIGPTLMIVIVTTIKAYIDYKESRRPKVRRKAEAS